MSAQGFFKSNIKIIDIHSYYPTIGLIIVLEPLPYRSQCFFELKMTPAISVGRVIFDSSITHVASSLWFAYLCVIFA